MTEHIVKGWMQSWTGRRIDLPVTDPEQICIEDIAHHLAIENRYSGATFRPYSVGEHCVRVARLLKSENADPVVVKQGLLHDASEAYMKDIPAPWKQLRYRVAAGSDWLEMDPFAEYRKLEKSLERLIFRKFGLPEEQSEDVTAADLILLSTEKRDLLGPAPSPWGLTYEPMAETIIPWPWRAAETSFLSMFKDLFG